MRNATKFVLCLAASAFAAMPMFAQHGGGHGGGMGGPGASMGSAHSSAADSHSSAADNHSSAGSNSHSGAKTPDQLLSQNSKLSSKLQSLLPAGTNVQQAAQGFKNLGQFVAAVHVSHNLGIPFDQLKATMIGPPTQSLGQAIHTLKPAANSTQESKNATKQAKQDINDSKTS
jgi:hypothetical protein